MANILETIVWPEFKKIEPSARLGGILARKPGYHNSRDHLPNTDYSVAQFSIDRQGPADEGSAIDITFPDAQAGNYATIKKYSNRLYAVRNEDEQYRTKYIREFFGQIDSDSGVEGWDFTKNRAASADSSHLWHIHLSVHRGYIESTLAAKAILSILKGQSLASWIQETNRDVTFVKFNSHLPVLRFGDSDPVVKNDGTDYVKKVQRQLGITADGDYGPVTRDRIKTFGYTGNDGTFIDNTVWRRLYAMWGVAGVTLTVPKAGTKRIVQEEHFTATLPVLWRGDSDANGGIDGTGTTYVNRAQRALKVTPDGIYGPETIAAVRALNIPNQTGTKIDLPVWARIYGLWGVKETGALVVSR